ncbi:MAG: MarR family transcriptional regulator [Candidatus Methanoperedens sp.]|nr:MarR family transcriptional regulator [Candidatus Methanoperedens sp.]MCE8428805.1 MarR family transcriptional regulator [Candidatus Methanoperedens sp.]
MVTSSFLDRIFGKTAQLTVLEYLLSNKDNDTYLSGIAYETGLSHSSVSRVIEPLIEQKIIKEKSLGKQIRIFSLNQDSDITKYLLKVHTDLKTMMNNSSDKK